MSSNLHEATHSTDGRVLGSKQSNYHPSLGNKTSTFEDGGIIFFGYILNRYVWSVRPTIFEPPSISILVNYGGFLVASLTNVPISVVS